MIKERRDVWISFVETRWGLASSKWMKILWGYIYYSLSSSHSPTHTTPRSPFRCGVTQQARVATPPRSGCPVYPFSKKLAIFFEMLITSFITVCHENFVRVIFCGLVICENQEMRWPKFLLGNSFRKFCLSRKTSSATKVTLYFNFDNLLSYCALRYLKQTRSSITW